MITREKIITWLQRTGKVLEENRDYLTQLDSDIGDADHGANMDRGFKKVASQLPALADKSISDIFKSTGMALISSVGGASGPLYGTFFLRAGSAVTGKQEIGPEDLAGLLQAGLAGIIERGRAQAGDKTMIDTLAPAVEACAAAVRENAGIKEALKKAVEAAEAGMKNTIPMQAKKGRASYLGERSIGHQDPGATSAYLILKELDGAAGEEA